MVAGAAQGLHGNRGLRHLSRIAGSSARAADERASAGASQPEPFGARRRQWYRPQNSHIGSLSAITRSFDVDAVERCPASRAFRPFGGGSAKRWRRTARVSGARSGSKSASATRRTSVASSLRTCTSTRTNPWRFKRRRMATPLLTLPLIAAASPAARFGSRCGSHPDRLPAAGARSGGSGRRNWASTATTRP